MSKKVMKRVAFDSYEDARARYKHQTLLQDYMELQQETEAARNNLMVLKQKKLTLDSEVRFLRRRHKFLLKNKSSTPQERVFVKPQPTQLRKAKKEKVQSKKQATLRKIPPAAEKKKAPRSIPSPGFDLNIGDSLFGINEHAVQRAVANQRVRINGPKVSPFLDSGPKDHLFRGQEPAGQTRKPVIDLNQISREEEEMQERYEPFDPPSQGFIRNDINEQHTDVHLSIRRNVGGVLVSGSGSGSSGQPGKRKKISWQDPVALRV